MGVSGQLYHLPLPSGAEPAATADVDLRDGPACDVGNTSATTCADKVVGDSVAELNEVVLYGLKLIAASGGPTFSWVSIVADLTKGPPAATSKRCYGNF